MDTSVRLWDALTGKEKHVLNGHTGLVTSVAFSGDGSRIISSSDDASVWVWDVLMNKKNLVLNGNTYSVNLFTSCYIQEIAKSKYGEKHTGWLLSPHGEGYLMFVSPGARLSDDVNILIIPQSFVAHIDFTHSRLGPNWGTSAKPDYRVLPLCNALKCFVAL